MSDEARAPYLVRLTGSKTGIEEAVPEKSVAARWQRVKQILDQALESPLERRKQVIEDLCEGDRKSVV